MAGEGKEVPRTLESDLIGGHATAGPNGGLTVSGVQDKQSFNGLITRALSEPQSTVALPANTNIAVVKVAFVAGDVLIQYWDQTLLLGVGDWATLATITGASKVKVTAKLCLQDSSTPGLSWQELSVSGDVLIAGWYEQNSQSGTSYRMIGAPERVLRDNMGSAPMVITDEGTTMMVESLPLTRDAVLQVTSSRAMVAGSGAQIPSEIAVEVMG